MLFKKLFRVLVIGGTMMGAASGCAARAADSQAGAGAGAKKGPADAGTAPDAGAKAQDTGGGAQGW